MDAAEAAPPAHRQLVLPLLVRHAPRPRRHVHRDARFTKTYEDMAPGLAQYVRDAIHANADRHES